MIKDFTYNHNRSFLVHNSLWKVPAKNLFSIKKNHQTKTSITKMFKKKFYLRLYRYKHRIDGHRIESEVCYGGKMMMMNEWNSKLCPHTLVLAMQVLLKNIWFSHPVVNIVSLVELMVLWMWYTHFFILYWYFIKHNWFHYRNSMNKQKF